jgi:hypothetical protein
MKKLTFIAVLAIVMMAGCNLQSAEELANIEKHKQDSIAIADSIQAKQESIKKAEREKINAVKIDSMKKFFIVKSDEFSGGTYYYHKNWGVNWPNRTTIYCYINNSGYIYLISNYFSTDWLFHTSITVLVDSKKFYSEEVETFKDANKTEVGYGCLWENVTYLSDDIIKAIASSTDKKIKVRFNGKQYYKDIELSDRDKKAFKQCWEFHNFLK